MTLVIANAKHFFNALQATSRGLDQVHLDRAEQLLEPSAALVRMVRVGPSFPGTYPS
jgi:hypothetical protein